MPKTTYVPGMSFEEFFIAGGYPRTSQGYIEAQAAYNQSKSNYEKYGRGYEVDPPNEGRGGDDENGVGRGARGGTRDGGGRSDEVQDPIYVPPRGSGEGGDRSSTGSVTERDKTAEDLLRDQFDRLSDPTFGLNFYERLVAASTPTLSDYLARLHATGGSAKQAQEQFEAARRAGQGGAFDAFSRFRLGTDQLQAAIAGDLLQNDQFLAGLEAQNDRFLQGLNFQGEQAGKDRNASLINSILSGGLGILGLYLGSKWNPLGKTGTPGYGGYPSFPNQFGGGGYYPGWGGSLATGGTGTPGYPGPGPYFSMSEAPATPGEAAGGAFGGMQQPGQMAFGNPSGPDPTRSPVGLSKRRDYEFLGY